MFLKMNYKTAEENLVCPHCKHSGGCTELTDELHQMLELGLGMETYNLDGSDRFLIPIPTWDVHWNACSQLSKCNLWQITLDDFSVKLSVLLNEHSFLFLMRYFKMDDRNTASLIHDEDLC